MSAIRIIDDHIRLASIGTNTHAQIDAHMEVIVVDNGNVGIGTDAPGAKLQAVVTGYADGITVTNIDSGTYANTASFRMMNDQGGTGAYFSLYSSNNTVNANLNNQLYVKNSVGGMKWLAKPGSNISFGIGASINDANDLVIGTDGDIGIGTTTPFLGWTTTPSPGIVVEGTSPKIGMYDTQGGNRWYIDAYSVTGLRFIDDTNVEVRMVIGNSGDVGIGTTTPTRKLDIDSDAVRLRTAKTITNSTDSGNQGDMCWDANYVYICVATNTWKRSSLITW